MRRSVEEWVSLRVSAIWEATILGKPSTIMFAPYKPKVLSWTSLALGEWLSVVPPEEDGTSLSDQNEAWERNVIFHNTRPRRTVCKKRMREDLSSLWTVHQHSTTARPGTEKQILGAECWFLQRGPHWRHPPGKVSGKHSERAYTRSGWVWTSTLVGWRGMIKWPRIRRVRIWMPYAHTAMRLSAWRF